MEAIRKIVDHSTNPLTIVLPEEFNNRKVEVMVLPGGKESIGKDVRLVRIFWKVRMEW